MLVTHRKWLCAEGCITATIRIITSLLFVKLILFHPCNETLTSLYILNCTVLHRLLWSWRGGISQEKVSPCPHQLYANEKHQEQLVRLLELWEIRNDKHHTWNRETWEEHEVPLSQLGRFPTCSLDFLLRCVVIGGSESLHHFQKTYPIVSPLSRSFNMSFLNYPFTHLKNFHMWLPVPPAAEEGRALCFSKRILPPGLFPLRCSSGSQATCH